MKRSRWLCACLVVLVAVPVVVGAAEEGRSWQVHNRLRVEYDDNIYQAETDTQDSFKIIEELQFLVNFNLQRTFVSLRYRPSYVWWDEREPDDDDFQHEFDLVWNQAFTPRLVLSTIDTLRRGLIPELTERGAIVRENQDFYYNTFNATLGYIVRPPTRVEVSGRYILMRYDNDDVADSGDFDLYVAGLTLRQAIVPETTVLGELRAESIDYESGGVDAAGLPIEDRGSETLYAGLGAEQIFSPNLLGSLRAGYQTKEFNDSDLGSASSPYGDVALTLLPSPRTRISAGAGFSLFETDVYPFANQERSRVFASLAHDVTARVSLYLSGAYTTGDYSADEAVEPGTVKDGSEEVLLLSGRVTFQMNRQNWLEAGWQYQDFSTDLERVDGAKLRASYERNRLDVGWKYQF